MSLTPITLDAIIVQRARIHRRLVSAWVIYPVQKAGDVRMISYKVYKDGTCEYVETIRVNKPFQVPGERIGSIVMDGKDLPGTVTQICLKLGEQGEVTKCIWVKQDADHQP